MASEATTQTSRADVEALQVAQAEQAGAEFEWHYGRLTRIGHFGEIGGREIRPMFGIRVNFPRSLSRPCHE